MDVYIWYLFMYIGVYIFKTSIDIKFGAYLIFLSSVRLKISQHTTTSDMQQFSIITSNQTIL